MSKGNRCIMFGKIEVSILGVVETRNTASSTRLRNPGTALELDRVVGAHVNGSPVESPVESLLELSSI